MGLTTKLTKNYLGLTEEEKTHTVLENLFDVPALKGYLGSSTKSFTLEDGSELICDVLAIFPVDGKDYIALLPQGDDPDAEIFLYRFEEKGDDDIDLINIEDDDEFERIADIFDDEFADIFYDDQP